MKLSSQQTIINIDNDVQIFSLILNTYSLIYIGNQTSDC